MCINTLWRNFSFLRTTKESRQSTMPRQDQEWGKKKEDEETR